ncbi:hypothetical protein MRX96_003900 [Rhipicephalus microplus]
MRSEICNGGGRQEKPVAAASTPSNNVPTLQGAAGEGNHSGTLRRSTRWGPLARSSPWPVGPPSLLRPARAPTKQVICSYSTSAGCPVPCEGRCVFMWRCVREWRPFL